MKEEIADLAGFFTAIIAVIGNFFGLTDRVEELAVAAAKTGDRAQMFFRRNLGKYLARPVMSFMLTIAVCWGFLLWAESSVAGQLPDELVTVGLVGISAITVMGVAVFFTGRSRPLNVPFFLSAAVLTAASVVMSVHLHRYALDKGGWLWAIAGASGILTCVVMGVIGTIVQLLLNGADAIYQLLFETVVEPAASTGLVITWQNKHEKLAQLRGVLPLGTLAAIAVGIPAFVTLSYIPFFYIMCFSVTVWLAEYFGTIYLLIILSGVGCRMIGRDDVVTKAQERLYLLLFKYAWMFFPIVWAWPYIAGAQVVPVLPLALILLFSVIGIVALYVTLKAIKDWKWHTIALAAAPALFTFYFLVLGFLVYGGVWSGRLPGVAVQTETTPVTTASSKVATASSFKALVMSRMGRFYTTFMATVASPKSDQNVAVEPPPKAPVVLSHAKPSPKRLAQANADDAQIDRDFAQTMRELGIP